MSKNLPQNPYFDPNPIWYINTLRILCILSLCLSGIGYYTIAFHSPKQISQGYKRLLIWHFAIFLMFELIITIFCPMIVLLPFIAGGGVGICTYFGLAGEHQIVILFTSILVLQTSSIAVIAFSAALTVVIPLFYYRMRTLLPDNHILNYRLVHYSLNLGLYFCCYVLPPPLIYLSIHYQDSNEVKRYYELTYNMTFPNLYSPQVVAIVTSGNPWAMVDAFAALSASALIAILIIYCSYSSYDFLKKTSLSLSVTTKKHHINLLKSLLAMILVLGAVVTVIIPLVAVLFLTNSKRADVVIGLIALGAAAYPMAITVYFVNYKPYRDYYIRTLRRIYKGKLLPTSSPYVSVVRISQLQ